MFFSNDCTPQIYVYRGAIQHHGIVTHVTGAERDDGSSAETASGSTPPSTVQVVHFDSQCDGVETTTLESFLKARKVRSRCWSIDASAWAHQPTVDHTDVCLCA